MTAHPGVLAQVGAACFGLVVGYITYRTLIRTTDKSTISDLAAVIGAIGGAAVTGLFAPGSAMFAWYSIGLVVGMACFFTLYGMLNSWKQLGTVMSAPTVVAGAGTPPVAGQNAPNG